MSLRFAVGCGKPGRGALKTLSVAARSTTSRTGILNISCRKGVLARNFASSEGHIPSFHDCVAIRRETLRGPKRDASAASADSGRKDAECTKDNPIGVV